MPKFDTRVQQLRYSVLKEITRHAYNGDILESMYDIPKTIVPGPKASFRCCIYKERAIVEERVKVVIKARSKADANVIKVIPIACDECPLGGYTVSDACRGCIAHRCAEACPRKCITFDSSLRAHIDKTHCVNCGMCAKACPYTAIENRIRPCERACKVKAISPNPETNEAMIDDNKCIHCGSCVYMCPFGAIVDESYVLEIIDMLKSQDKVYAVVAPSIAGNCNEHKLSQVITAIKELGFAGVFEAAIGADMVALNEGKELAEHGKLTSSCCPAFASFIRKYNPTLVPYISSSLSPMATIAQYIKTREPGVKCIFIGPCTAKKAEQKWEKVSPYIDSAMTFEELQAMIDGKGIDIDSLPESEFIKGGSFYGRGFAKCGGLTTAVNESLKEQNVDFVAKGLPVDGIDNIKKALAQFKSPTCEFNFIEGMACEGGCIGGPCNLTHQLKNKTAVDKFSSESGKDIIANVEEGKI